MLPLVFRRNILFSRSYLLCKGIRTPIRWYPALPKRFYKKTGVLHCDGSYEITLDNRKLKTPKGQVFRVGNELLALGVAAEWDAQKDTIQQSIMHLTSLCSTAQDNPSSLTKYDAVQYVLNFLETDTVLFHSNSEELDGLQNKEWGAVISWFKKRFEVDIEPTMDISNPKISSETKKEIERHLMSYSLDTIHGFVFAVESLKSLILTLACVERKLNVDQAVLLSRLEEEYQTGKWGRVEWSHDMNQLDLQARTAAAIIYVHLTSMSDSTKSKLISVL